YQSLADSYKKVSEDIHDLCDMVESERTLNDNLFDNICLGMLVSPKETFEMMLKQVEREEKIADTTGDGWKWSYKFSLIPRLKMAFQLIFG
ncbi:MAG TPA: hypothetical protein GX731_06615, partial [Clostridiales bacterium]|nr:hypothetical protein [Clostridiales bacterium]